MMMRQSLVLIICLLGFTQGFLNPYKTSVNIQKNTDNDAGQPLFLTPYLEQGKIEEARNLSLVKLSQYKYPSYSGFLTVNKEYNSNLFFWFFPSQNGDKNAPVLLWLQGGPGASSLFGLFVENGPIGAINAEKIFERNISWNSQYSLLYIDNPVGTGFSFVDKDDGYTRTQDDVARDLYAGLSQFFQIFTDYARSPFYVTGESYAGKYVPSISYRIHRENQNTSAKIKINLVGLSMGNGWTDPYRQYAYGPLLYQIGLIDENQLFYFNLQSDLVRYAISQQRFIDAFKISDALIDGDLINTTSYFRNATGLKAYFNYLYTDEPANFTNYVDFITTSDTREQIHVGNLTYQQDNRVEFHLMNDVFQSIPSEQLTTLFNNYKVLVYNGLLDIICAESLTLNWLADLEWTHASEYKTAQREIWKVEPNDIEIAGYIKTVNRFMQVGIRKAGHMVPTDQPRSMLDLLDRFIKLT